MCKAHKVSSNAESEAPAVWSLVVNKDLSAASGFDLALLINSIL